MCTTIDYVTEEEEEDDPEGEDEEEEFVVVVMGGGGGKNAFCNWGYMAFIVSDWFNSSFNIGCRISGSSWGT